MEKQGDLAVYRSQIDEIDKSLIILLKARATTVTAIGEYKAANNLPVCDAAREAQKLEKVRAEADDEKTAAYLADIFEGIMRASCRLEEN